MGAWRAVLPDATVPVAGTLTRFEYRLLHRAGFVTLLLKNGLRGLSNIAGASRLLWGWASQRAWCG